MHDFTEPLSLSGDTLLNEAVRCACSKHKVNQITGVLHFSRTLQKHPWCHFGHVAFIFFIQKTTDGTKESFHFKAENRGLIVF